MKLSTKQEVNTKIGEASFWKPIVTVNACNYIAGIEDIDAIVGSQNFLKSIPMADFKKHPQGICVSFRHNFRSYLLPILQNEIKSIVFQKGGVFDVESKSVIGRAIVGGLLLGPLGALVGGASGLKDNVHKDDDNLLITVFKDGGEQAILLKVNKGKANDVVQFFRTNYSGLFTIC